MREIKQGETLTLKDRYLDHGEANLPHVALEDSFQGFVRVEIAGDFPYPFKPVNDWMVEWIA